MSKIEQSMEKALKLRDRPVPIKKRESLPSPPDFSPDIPKVHVKEEESQVHLRDYLDVVIRRKRIVILFLVAIVTTVIVASLFMTPLFRAMTIIQLKSGKTKLVEFKDVYKVNYVLETEYNILKSKNLAKRVAAKVPSEHMPQSTDNGSFINSLTGFVPLWGDKKSGKENAKPRISAGTILRGLEIEPVKKTDLVKINFTSDDPAFAAYAANAIADEYIDFTEESTLKPSQLGEERLKKEVTDMRAELESSERQLNEYIARSQYLLTLDDDSYTNLLAKKFSKLTDRLDQAISERLSTEATYQEVKKSGIDYTIVLEKPIIKSLMTRLIDLEAEYSRLLIIHKPAYPKMVQLKDEIEKLTGKIEIEEQNIINTLHTDYKLALKKEKLLATAIGDLQQELNTFQKNMIHFLTLKREVETNREIYTSLLQRLKEVSVSTALTESNVQILDRANVPRRPFKPNTLYNIVLAMIFGLLGGVGLAFFVEYFDNSVKTDEEVEKISGLPVLGKVPLTKTTQNNLIHNNPHDNTAFSEAFRSIGTRIQYANLPKLILITSPLEQEGKTLISASVAMSLISSLEKGIIIDADLRRPDVHSIFNLNNSFGLSSFLAGTCEFEGLIKKSPYSGLDVITAGPLPPNPSELLNSSRMGELIDSLSAAYDYIIFDSPPVLGMSDSLILSALTEGVIMVVKANSTPKDALVQTAKALESVHARRLGVILNGVLYKAKYAYSSYYNSSYLINSEESKKVL